MSSWQDFAEGSPEAAAWGKKILSKYGIAYLATVREDGAPRVHPVCPAFLGAEIYIGVMGSSPKLHDLRRDPRFVLHALPGPQDAEFTLRGRVRLFPEELAAELLRKRAASGDDVVTTTFFFLDIERADYAAYETAKGLRPVPTRTAWHAPEVQS
ncbi:pyridoxamine 5'-phosphate oxidase family protein [Amycolatopsis sp. CA-128772]|uniref:pyridoxamine 5'-phosphate oxidase family protein n=1 Tax=Amycolatopsis sp. CA-128772 TaxID=2073159 RepID=UPI001304D744|nr:pyridoxamine 5'-phosphate oxidase family protein [Amycolatopsis sp. CA-128772]